MSSNTPHRKAVTAGSAVRLRITCAIIICSCGTAVSFSQSASSPRSCHVSSEIIRYSTRSWSGNSRLSLLFFIFIRRSFPYRIHFFYILQKCLDSFAVNAIVLSMMFFVNNRSPSLQGAEIHKRFTENLTS